MSGPIVRKYGFPDYDRIFGTKEIQHGVDEPEAKTEGVNPTAAPPRDETPTDPKQPASANAKAPANTPGKSAD